MAGSIQDRGNGRYYLTVSNGFDSKGKRIRKTRTIEATGIMQARNLLAAFVTEVRQGEYVAPSYTRLSDYVEIWRKERETKIAASTLETYNYALNGRILPSIGHLKLENIKPIHIENSLEEMKEDGLSSSTIVKNHNILNSIFKLAVKNDILKNNPINKVDRPSITYKAGQVYDSIELEQLYHLLNQEENKQMVIMIKLALLTGMRKGELLALQWDDVDFSTNTINISQSLSCTKKHGYQLKEPKTKGSIRKVAPPSRFMSELKKHIHIKRQNKFATDEMWDDSFGDLVFSTFGKDNNDRMNLFGKPIHLNSPNRWWNRFLERVNEQLKEKGKEPPLKKIRFHDLRHTSATNLINKGANPYSISKRLGHSNINTTMNIYGHYLEEADQKIADMLDEDYI